MVEDIPSACAIAVHTNHVGCALLGTVLSVKQKKQLMSFDRIIVALDKDARKKSLHLQSRLQGRSKHSGCVFRGRYKKYASQ